MFEHGTYLFRHAAANDQNNGDGDHDDGKVKSLPAGPTSARVRQGMCSLFGVPVGVSENPQLFEKFMDRLCDF